MKYLFQESNSLEDRRKKTQWEKNPLLSVEVRIGYIAVILLIIAINENVLSVWIGFAAAIVFLIYRLIMHLTKKKNPDPYSKAPFVIVKKKHNSSDKL